MKSKQSLAILDKQEARKLLDKWLILRDLRIQNQMRIWNHFLPYSADVYLQYNKFLKDLKNHDLNNATQKLEKLQNWCEDWLKDEWLCLGRMHQIESIFSKKEWNLIQSTFKANVNNLVENLNNIKEQSEGKHQSILEGILKVVTFFNEDEKTIKEVFKEEVRNFTNLVEENMNEMGELAAKSLHGKICMGIPRYGELKGKKGRRPKDTKSTLKDLWNSLKEEDNEKCLEHAKKLKKFGEKNAIYYSQLISDLQHKRTNLSDESKKLELLIEENKCTTEMRRNGLYYSIGLYFQNTLELSLAGLNKIAKKEYKKAIKLTFESLEESMEVTIRELLDDPDKYDGKNVKISGLVTNINETKHKSAKGEVFFITFELLQDRNTMEFYFPRYWLTDNGLKEEEFAEFTGTFNKKCKKSNRPDIHVIRQSYGKYKNFDWISHCKWLVHKWWDGYTGKATANWTLGILTPASDLFEGKLPSKKVYKNLLELKKKYPSIRAGLRTFRSPISDRIIAKINSNYAKSLYFLYIWYTLIDSVLYLTLMSVLKEKLKLKIPSVRFYTPESPSTNLADLKMILICKIEKHEFESREDLAWLIYEIDSFLESLDIKGDIDVKENGAKQERPIGIKYHAPNPPMPPCPPDVDPYVWYLAWTLPTPPWDNIQEDLKDKDEEEEGEH